MTWITHSKWCLAVAHIIIINIIVIAYFDLNRTRNVRVRSLKRCYSDKSTDTCKMCWYMCLPKKNRYFTAAFNQTLAECAAAVIPQSRVMHTKSIINSRLAIRIISIHEKWRAKNKKVQSFTPLMYIHVSACVRGHLTVLLCILSSKFLTILFHFILYSIHVCPFICIYIYYCLRFGVVM